MQSGLAKPVELGLHIVAHPGICGGQPTFRGSRILVWVVLEQLERGLTWDEIVQVWKGRVSKTAIAEAVAVSPVVIKHEPFRGFHAHTRRKSARRSEAVAA